MQLTHNLPHLTISAEREQIPVDTLHPSRVPDKDWRFVDKAGHGHFWSGSELPTLYWVETGTEWVGDEHDGDEVPLGEWRCRQCGETIEPRKRMTYGNKPIFAPMRFTVSLGGERFVLDERGYSNALNAWTKSLRKFALYTERECPPGGVL